ncbi:MAG: hypothetical protein R3A52_16005 [Polyangiales bacterium]
MSSAGLQVTLRVLAVSHESMRVAYAVRNASSTPVLVLDRRWDPALEALDPAWVEVDLADVTAWLSRMHVVVPPEVLLSEPRLPYGRVLDAGAVSETELTVALPLQERGSLDAVYEQGPVEGDAGLTSVDALLMRVGWVAMPSVDTLPPESRDEVVIEGERLHWLSKEFLDEAQRVARSEPVAVTLVGRLRGSIA